MAGRRSIRGVVTPVLGRSVRALARLRGGGSALPGRVVELVDPGFLGRVLGGVPRGVAVVSGTNGKTTTTRIAVELLRGQGLRVFTNPTGSNLTRGVASALLDRVSLDGRMDADVAVLELDEAYAVRFSELVAPRYCVLLNVMRDQLDRFGEVDHTAALLARTAAATTGAVILNRDDPLVAPIGRGLPSSSAVRTFGAARSLRSLFPSDGDLYGEPAGNEDAAAGLPQADVELAEFADGQATFRVGSRRLSTGLRLPGAYNALNAAAALALTRAVCGPDLEWAALARSLGAVTPAFGRGETIRFHGRPIELVLVKNPGGFRQALRAARAEAATMIAIDDEWADGRDVSWLWDVDFAPLRSRGVAVVSGTRAWDMALRLRYDEVPVGRVEASPPRGLRELLRAAADRPARIFATYTAMLELRHGLGRLTRVDQVGVR